ncbi:MULTISPECIES: hypothetical protein [unclassified Streptomyces]|uniref:hypothetical protein n=1 Tax=unclassified Streptomyces TaxID=2593676 RepID=UPI0033BC9716
MSALDKRTPGRALNAILPTPTEPLLVNLFGADPGDTFGRRFDPARLHRRNPTPTGSAHEQGERP